MAKVYIVPEQVIETDGVISNTAWEDGIENCKATLNGTKYDVTWYDGQGSYFGGAGYYFGGEYTVTLGGLTRTCVGKYMVTNDDGVLFWDAEVESGHDGETISLYYGEDSVDPDDPDAPKPDNIDIHTASKNQVIEATRPAQTRSSLNWMDRLERILHVETVDEKARSVEKYLDAIQHRGNLSPIIRKTKDIERPESDSQDDNVEEVTN